jgi:transcriptional regulator with XRE-family HTH domain
MKDYARRNAEGRSRKMSKSRRNLPEVGSFGVQFGRLVRSKRAVEGLSQDALALRSELTKSKISELETGKIGNPQSRTVDALIVALNITDEERAACYLPAEGILPPLLLETLALRFGFTHPSAQPDELEAFLRDKSVEFAALQLRLAQIQKIEGAVAALVTSAEAALGMGDFQHADQHLQEAEQIQLTSATVMAVAKQSELRIARAQAALLSGDVSVAATHWSVASTYFQAFDRNQEAETRYAACNELRGYGYRYRSVIALLAAETALLLNQEVWTPEANLRGWCRTTNALGATRSRLAQFDEPENFLKHIRGAEEAFEAVRATCSKTILPYYFAASSGNLASLYCERQLSVSDQDYTEKVCASIDMQLQAVDVLSKKDYPLEWGIFHHNLGTSYISLAHVLPDQSEKLNALNSSATHLNKSFEVRNPEEALQYWVASSRSLAEALIDRGHIEMGNDSHRDIERARTILDGALAKINEREHPHQWAELQTQLSRISLE